MRPDFLTEHEWSEVQRDAFQKQKSDALLLLLFASPHPPTCRCEKCMTHIREHMRVMLYLDQQMETLNIVEEPAQTAPAAVTTVPWWRMWSATLRRLLRGQ